MAAIASLWIGVRFAVVMRFEAATQVAAVLQ